MDVSNFILNITEINNDYKMRVLDKFLKKVNGNESDKLSEIIYNDFITKFTSCKNDREIYEDFLEILNSREQEVFMKVLQKIDQREKITDELPEIIFRNFMKTIERMRKHPDNYKEKIIPTIDRKLSNKIYEEETGEENGDSLPLSKVTKAMLDKELDQIHKDNKKKREISGYYWDKNTGFVFI